MQSEVQTVKVETVSVTPAMAEEWLEKYHFEFQRDITSGRVEQYAELMRAGMWGRGDGVIVIAHVNDSPTGHLIAGQHRLKAVVVSGVTIPMLVEHRSYPSYSAIISDYAECTNRLQTMTREQSLKVLGTQSALRVDKRTMRAAASGLVVIGTGFKTWAKTSRAGVWLAPPSRMNEALLRWSDAIRALDICIEKAPVLEKYNWYRSPVAAMFLVTFKFCPAAAYQFWSDAMANDGLKRKTPEHAIHEFINNTHSPLVAHLEDYSFRLANAWNAKQRGDEVTCLKGRIAGSENGIRIMGTPFNGRSNIDPLALVIGK